MRALDSSCRGMLSMSEENGLSGFSRLISQLVFPAGGRQQPSGRAPPLLASPPPHRGPKATAAGGGRQGARREGKGSASGRPRLALMLPPNVATPPGQGQLRAAVTRLTPEREAPGSHCSAPQVSSHAQAEPGRGTSKNRPHRKAWRRQSWGCSLGSDPLPTRPTGQHFDLTFLSECPHIDSNSLNPDPPPPALPGPSHPGSGLPPAGSLTGPWAHSLTAQEAPQDRAPHPTLSLLAHGAQSGPQALVLGLSPSFKASNPHHRLNRVPQNSCLEVLTSSSSESPP